MRTDEDRLGGCYDVVGHTPPQTLSSFHAALSEQLDLDVELGLHVFNPSMNLP